MRKLNEVIETDIYIDDKVDAEKSGPHSAIVKEVVFIRGLSSLYSPSPSSHENLLSRHNLNACVVVPFSRLLKCCGLIQYLLHTFFLDRDCDRRNSIPFCFR